MKLDSYFGLFLILLREAVKRIQLLAGKGKRKGILGLIAGQRKEKVSTGFVFMVAAQKLEPAATYKRAIPKKPFH